MLESVNSVLHNDWQHQSFCLKVQACLLSYWQSFASSLLVLWFSAFASASTSLLLTPSASTPLLLTPVHGWPVGLNIPPPNPSPWLASDHVPRHFAKRSVYLSGPFSYSPSCSICCFQLKFHKQAVEVEHFAVLVEWKEKIARVAEMFTVRHHPSSLRRRREAVLQRPLTLPWKLWLNE